MGDSRSSPASLVSDGSTAGLRAMSPARIISNAPPPEQWTLVKELNMEKREPCEIWRSGVNHQLFKMKQQLTSCGSVIQRLERGIEEDRQAMLTSRTMAAVQPSAGQTPKSTVVSFQSSAES